MPKFGVMEMLSLLGVNSEGIEGNIGCAAVMGVSAALGIGLSATVSAGVSAGVGVGVGVGVIAGIGVGVESAAALVATVDTWEISPHVATNFTVIG